MTRRPFTQTDPHEVTRQLYRQAVLLRSPRELDTLLAFFGRFRRFSVFNTALIHAQRPAATLLATAVQWLRLERTVNDGTAPVVVLAPFGPIQFLFDESDTAGRALTEAERAALLAPGPAPRANWEQTVDGAKTLGVVVEAGRSPDPEPWSLLLHSDQGRARGEGRYISWELVVDGDLEPARRFLRLTHELGHIYCGHRGGHPTGAWRSRPDLGPAEQQAEAELVSVLVCTRAGCLRPSVSGLQEFMDNNGISSLDLGAVISAADLVESRNAVAKSKSHQQQKPNDPLPGQLGMFQ